MNPGFLKLISLLILCVFSVFGINKQPQMTTIHASIQGCRNSKGHLLVSLFDNSDGFPSNNVQAIRTERLNIEEGRATVSWNNLPKGVYAVAVLHDENDDHKMNTSFFGLPKEGYAFSNNVMGFAGPPSFDRASFNAEGNFVIQIKMRY